MVSALSHRLARVRLRESLAYRLIGHSPSPNRRAQPDIAPDARQRGQPERDRAVGEDRDHRAPGRARRTPRTPRSSLPRRLRCHPAAATGSRACPGSSPSRARRRGLSVPNARKEAPRHAMSKPQYATAPSRPQMAIANQPERGANAGAHRRRQRREPRRQPTEPGPVRRERRSQSALGLVREKRHRRPQRERRRAQDRREQRRACRVRRPRRRHSTARARPRRSPAGRANTESSSSRLSGRRSRGAPSRRGAAPTR